MAYKKSLQRRNEILAAAQKLFAEKGYYGTDLKEIAAELDIAHTGIYYYFRNKEEIASAIYDEAVYKMLAQVAELKNTGSFSPLCLCIMQYLLIMEQIAFNPATSDYFFDMIHYRNYSHDDMLRVCDKYYTALADLFKSQGRPLSPEDFISYVLTSDAYAKALLLAIKQGILNYTKEDALDYFFSHLLLPDLHIPFEEYEKEKKKAWQEIFPIPTLARRS